MTLYAWGHAPLDHRRRDADRRRHPAHAGAARHRVGGVRRRPRPDVEPRPRLRGRAGPPRLREGAAREDGADRGARARVLPARDPGPPRSAREGGGGRAVLLGGGLEPYPRGRPGGAAAGGPARHGARGRRPDAHRGGARRLRPDPAGRGQRARGADPRGERRPVRRHRHRRVPRRPEGGRRARGLGDGAGRRATCAVSSAAASTPPPSGSPRAPARAGASTWSSWP